MRGFTGGLLLALLLSATPAFAQLPEGGETADGQPPPQPAPPPVPAPAPEPVPAPGTVHATPAEPHGATGTVSGATNECANCEEIAKQNLRELRRIIDAGLRRPFGEVAAAVAKKMDVEHDLLIHQRGCGKFIGTRAYKPENLPRDVRPTDCTQYIVDVLRQSFAVQGKSDDFERVFARAMANSSNGLKGTELVRALREELGWSTLFWAADPNTNDANGEHRYAAYVARTHGTYYRIPIDRTKQVVGYRLDDPEKRPDRTALEKLKKVPFGVIAAKGGMHMALIVEGKVYEVHWSDGCESMRLIEDVDLDKWIWNSGIIAAPKEDVDRAWGASR